MKSLAYFPAHFSILAASLVFTTSLALGSNAIAAGAAEHDSANGIAWRKDNDVDAAFALAKSSKKPVFLYWGAVWCPPCNQVKATIFNRQDFIEKSRHFVPVYLDGDTPGAQKLAAQFKVRGYPTMILFKPDGTEITRLPGEVDAQRYVKVLSLAMNANSSVEDNLKLALSGKTKLSNDNWRLLADYSWDDPQQKLIPANELAESLLRLSALSPTEPNATRLLLKALVAMANEKEKSTSASAHLDKGRASAKVMKALSNPALARDNIDLLSGSPAELLALLSEAKSPARDKLAFAWNTALVKLGDDQTLSKTDRLSAVNAQVALASMDDAKPAPALLADIQKRVAVIEQQTTDAYERQSVVNAAAHTLTDAGLLDASDALLKAELKRSHSPYYFMSTLGSNAKKRGDKVAAVNWYEQAYNASKGPATRLQWGVSYVTNLVEMHPTDDARIEKAVQNVLAEVGGVENAFYERNRNYLEKMGKKLLEWNADGKHQIALKKMKTQLDTICDKLPAQDQQKTVCQGVISLKS